MTDVTGQRMSKDPLHDELLFALRGLGRNLGWAYMQGGFFAATPWLPRSTP
jgi:hypothetical protein